MKVQIAYKAWHRPIVPVVAAKLVAAFQTLEQISVRSGLLEGARGPNGVRCLKCEHDKVSKFTLKGRIRKH
jgi:hypothetical protein